MSRYEIAARQIKARKMADVLLAQAPAAYWLDSEAAHPAPVAFWTQVAEAAGCQARKAPSPATWGEVLDNLRAAARVESLGRVA